MQFWTYGLFPANPENRKALWDAVRSMEEFDGLARNELRDAIGCYAFVMKRGEKLIPWYIGKTNAKSGFYREIFAPHKIMHYNGIITEKAGWTPHMLLFPLVTASYRLSRSFRTNRTLIEWMERTLIGMALAKNPRLYNSRDTKNLKNCIVDGVFGNFDRHQRYPAALEARRAFTDHNDWVN